MTKQFIQLPNPAGVPMLIAVDKITAILPYQQDESLTMIQLGGDPPSFTTTSYEEVKLFIQKALFNPHLVIIDKHE